METSKKAFFRFLGNEVYRLFHTAQFLAVLALLGLLALIDGILAWRLYAQNLEQTLAECTLRGDGTFANYPWLQIYTLYNSWIGGRVNQAIPQVFLYTLPIYAVIPYSWSYLSEEKSGYARTMVTRLGRLGYFGGKYISVFLSGFLTVAIPMAFSLLFTACLVPAYRPDVNFALYYQISSTHLMCPLYYTHPLLTAFLNILEIGVFAGAWATVPYVVSFFVKNRFVALFSPYLVLLFLIATAERALVYRSYLETSIFDYLWLTSASGTQSLPIFLGEMGAFLMLPLLLVGMKGGRADVF